jgi:hypothetical protein
MLSFSSILKWYNLLCKKCTFILKNIFVMYNNHFGSHLQKVCVFNKLLLVFCDNNIFNIHVGINIVSSHSSWFIATFSLFALLIIY